MREKVLHSFVLTLFLTGVALRSQTFFVDPLTPSSPSSAAEARRGPFELSPNGRSQPVFF